MEVIVVGPCRGGVGDDQRRDRPGDIVDGVRFVDRAGCVHHCEEVVAGGWGAGGEGEGNVERSRRGGGDFDVRERGRADERSRGVKGRTR